MDRVLEFHVAPSVDMEAMPATPLLTQSPSRPVGAKINHDESLAEPPIGRQPVAYYAICDLKYNRQADPGHRLKILELGSGLASRFSGHGQHIPIAYKCSYFLANSLDCGPLVDNKKMTHD